MAAVDWEGQGEKSCAEESCNFKFESRFAKSFIANSPSTIVVRNSVSREEQTRYRVSSNAKVIVGMVEGVECESLSHLE